MTARAVRFHCVVMQDSVALAIVDILFPSSPTQVTESVVIRHVVRMQCL